MADALTAAVVGGIVGSVAPRAIDAVVGIIKKGKAAREAKARENAESFQKRLEERIEKKFPDLELQQEKLKLVEDAVAEPSTAVLLEEVTKAAATTSVPETHDVLAELLMERLTSPGRSWVARSTQEAVRLIRKLDKVHLDVLGAASLTYLQWTPHSADSDQPERFIQAANTYFELARPWLEGISYSRTDLMWVVNVSAAWLVTITRPKLEQRIKAMWLGKSTADVQPLQKSEWYAELNRLWRPTGSDVGLEYLDLLPVGLQIGVTHRDLILGMENAWSSDLEKPIC